MRLFRVPLTPYSARAGHLEPQQLGFRAVARVATGGADGYSGAMARSSCGLVRLEASTAHAIAEIARNNAAGAT